MRRPLTPTCTLVLSRGDITQADTDAIVNAANASLLGGGGVDGAIHRAAGPELLQACRALPASHGMRCPPGEARITPGFGLRARFVIHAVGPIYGRTPDAPGVLAGAHRSALALANASTLVTVAFPAISCGAYGYPPDEAAPIALMTCQAHAGSLREIHFRLFGADTWRAWSDAAAALA